jgi:predicted nucleotidyltransferase
MKSREEVLEILRSAKPALTRDFKVRALALFGSYARGEQGEKSDVDILVDVDPEIGLGFVSLADRIEELVGLPVELVSKRAIKPSYWNHIEHELIYV